MDCALLVQLLLVLGEHLLLVFASDSLSRSRDVLCGEGLFVHNRLHSVLEEVWSASVAPIVEPEDKAQGVQLLGFDNDMGDM